MVCQEAKAFWHTIFVLLYSASFSIPDGKYKFFRVTDYA